MKQYSRRVRLNFFGAPVCRGKSDLPEIRVRGIKLDGGLETFGRFARRPDDAAGQAFLSGSVFKDQARFGGKMILHDKQRAVSVYAESMSFERNRFALKCHVYRGPDAQQYTLAAAAVFSDKLTGPSGTVMRIRARRRRRILRKCVG